jgi:hypothetical protein
MAVFVTISCRTAAELAAKASELRQMAAVATTLHIVAALHRLADRYDDAAMRARSRAEAAGPSGVPQMEQQDNAN